MLEAISLEVKLSGDSSARYFRTLSCRSMTAGRSFLSGLDAWLVVSVNVYESGVQPNGAFEQGD